MEQVNLEVQLREEKGKQAVKKLRENSLIPAVVYKKAEEVLSIKFDKKDFHRVIHTQAGENVIITLKFKSDKKIKDKTVIIKEIQHNPLTDAVLHVDFNQISLTEKIEVNVPIIPKGECLGVKEGGVLAHVLKELHIECLPTRIPQSIEADITNLKIGDLLHVNDLLIPSGIKVITETDAVVFSVEAPKVEKVEVAAVAEEAQEPEVIKQKKELPEEEEKTKETKKERE
ncbi:MAG: 50S ribosomal protein L25 [Candidatus Omnitrophica bacterium]|nr:50S ribosomal protein L25 [Candidatus Omnitrophota bacterium]